MSTDGARTSHGEGEESVAVSPTQSGGSAVDLATTLRTRRVITRQGRSEDASEVSREASDRGFLDSSYLLSSLRIDASNRDDLLYWARVMNVNAMELEAAIERAGTGVVAVMRYLDSVALAPRS